MIHIYGLADTYVTTTLRDDIKQYQSRTYIGNNNPSGHQRLVSVLGHLSQLVAAAFIFSLCCKPTAKSQP
jgi:hypothetical protein